VYVTLKVFVICPFSFNINLNSTRTPLLSCFTLHLGIVRAGVLGLRCLQASHGRRHKKKLRAQRVTSNVFSKFDTTQIEEFKEAFAVIDTNNDGFIDKTDLFDILSGSSQSPPTDAEIAGMLGSTEKINYIMFLSMFADKMEGVDPEEVIRNAFGCFDPEGNKMIAEDQLKSILTTMGQDKMTEEEVEEFMAVAPFDAAGNFQYNEFVTTLKHGGKKA